MYWPRPSSVLLLLLCGAVQAQEALGSWPTLPRGQASIAVMDRSGHFLGRLQPQKRYWVSLDRIPAFLQKALLAVEDSRFYEHGGVDYQGIARAVVKDVIKGKLVQGGSTITQQLIKNKYLSSERSLDRKLKEANMAMDFEKRYSKRQILEMYFNEIYYGNGIWGIAQAARFYFDKSPEDLSDAECLLLAGVPKNPSGYNPFGEAEHVSSRRNMVLRRLQDLHLVSPMQTESLCRAWVTRPANPAPEILVQIRSRLVERFGAEAVEQGGLHVFTTVDLTLQKQAELALREGVKRLAPGLQGAILCMDPTSGDILAAVGDAVGGQSALNRAFLARRQPGSSIKPLIYTAALEKGLTAADVRSDEPVSYDRGNGHTWTPQNYAGERFGNMPLRQALAHSSNTIAVKVLDEVGVPSFVEFAGRMGLRLHPENGLSLALGTDEVSLKELAQAYTPLAAGGVRAEARLILRIHNLRQGTWQEDAPLLTPACSPQAAFIATQMMKEVLATGTAKGLHAFAQAHPAAGKTGTTDNYVDAWFVGYTPALLTGVWLGCDRPKSMGRGFTGGSAAAPIWGAFMRKAVSFRPAEDFPRPEGVTSLFIDPATGQPATPDSPVKLEEWFVSGSEPGGSGIKPLEAPLPEPERPEE